LPTKTLDNFSPRGAKHYCGKCLSAVPFLLFFFFLLQAGAKSAPLFPEQSNEAIMSFCAVRNSIPFSSFPPFLWRSTRKSQANFFPPLPGCVTAFFPPRSRAGTKGRSLEFPLSRPFPSAKPAGHPPSPFDNFSLLSISFLFVAPFFQAIASKHSFLLQGRPISVHFWGRGGFFFLLFFLPLFFYLPVKTPLEGGFFGQTKTLPLSQPFCRSRIRPSSFPPPERAFASVPIDARTIPAWLFFP